MTVGLPRAVGGGRSTHPGAGPLRWASVPVLLLTLAACAGPSSSGYRGGATPAVGSPAAARGAAPLPSPGELEVLGEAGLDWTVRTLEGGTFTLERFRGRPLFLNVWATWCPPCVAELESIRALMDSLGDTEVAFLLVSPEDADAVRPFLERLGYPLPVALEHTRMPASWGVEALPTTVVVDRAGRIVLRHRGAADWDQEPVRAFLRRLEAGS